MTMRALRITRMLVEVHIHDSTKPERVRQRSTWFHKN